MTLAMTSKSALIAEEPIGGFEYLPIREKLNYFFIDMEVGAKALVAAGAKLKMIYADPSHREFLDEIRSVPLFDFVHRMASDLLEPEAFLEFYKNRPLLRKVMNLPKHEQKHLRKDPMVKVAERTPDGDITHRLVHVMKLKPPEMKVVFGKDHIRSVKEQDEYENRKLISVARKRTLRADKVKGCFVTANGEKIMSDDFFEALPDLISQKTALALVKAAYKKDAN